MKSQVALEYLLVVGFGLAVVIPVFYYSIIYSSESVMTSQAQDAVNTLAKNADYVYSLGSGSSAKVTITIPQKVLNTTIQDKFILIQLKLSSGITDIKAMAKANLTGSIPNTPGTYNIFLNMTEKEVKISKG